MFFIFLPSFLAGWMLFKDKCFMFKGKKDDIKANWSDARSWCRAQEGDLAVIDDQYENGKPDRERLSQEFRKAARFILNLFFLL